MGQGWGSGGRARSASTSGATCEGGVDQGGAFGAGEVCRGTRHGR